MSLQRFFFVFHLIPGIAIRNLLSVVPALVLGCACVFTDNMDVLAICEGYIHDDAADEMAIWGELGHIPFLRRNGCC